MNPLCIAVLDRDTLADRPFDFDFPHTLSSYGSTEAHQTAERIQGADIIITNKVVISAEHIAANPQQALTEFLHKLEGLDKQSRALTLSQLFGTEYSDDIALLVGSLGEYEKALGLVADKGQVVGAMQKEVANAMSTSEAQIAKAKQEIINVAIEVGEKLLPLVEGEARDWLLLRTEAV